MKTVKKKKKKKKKTKSKRTKFIRDFRDRFRTGEDAVDDDADDEKHEVLSKSNLVVCFESCFPNHSSDEDSHVLIKCSRVATSVHVSIARRAALI